MGSAAAKGSERSAAYGKGERIAMIPALWQFFYWLWVGSEIVIGVGTRTKKSTGQTHDRGSLLLLWLVLVVSLTAAIWHSEVTPPDMFGGPHILKWIGLVILIMALAIRWTAIYTLGKAFSSNVAILDSQKLNQSGIYRFVRHPSYLGLWLVFIAVGVHSRNWLSFALATIPTTAALLYRIHVEEDALIQAFGDQYIVYAKSTKRLIPGIY
jgi:protein-S-isoprenylcysteine O-methyltransferase Ste14